MKAYKFNLLFTVLLFIGFGPRLGYSQLVDMDQFDYKNNSFITISDYCAYHFTNEKPAVNELHQIKDWRILDSIQSIYEKDWLVVKIRLKKNDDDFYLRLDDEINLVQAYFLDKEQTVLDLQKAGKNIGIKDKRIVYSFYNLLEINKLDTYEIYLVMATDQLLKIPEIDLVEKQRLFAYRSAIFIRTAIFFSMMFIMAFYNLIIYLRIKRKLFLQYFALIASLAVFITQPVLGMYLPTHVAMYIVILTACAINTFSASFTIHYLELGENLPFFKTLYTRIVQSVLGLAVLYTFMVLLDWQLFLLKILPILLSFITLFNVGLNLVTAIRAVKRKIKNSKSYAYANIAFLIGSAIYIGIWLLYVFGLVPRTFFVSNLGNYAFLIGSTSQVLLYSLVMSNYIMDIQREKFELQVKLNKKLEGKVESRNLKLKKANKQIKQQAEELTNLNSLKNKLIAILSHDLKSPLNSLQGVLSLYGNQYISKQEFEENILNVRQTLNNTLTLTNNLIHWSKSQMNGLVVDKVPINLVDIIHEVIGLFTPNIKAKNLKISLKLSERLDLSLDKQMAEIVLRNVLNNSIKYSETEGTIIITARENESEALISIHDNGIGMSEAFKATLLKDQSTFSITGTKNETGTGLGLVLSKEMMELNNGALEIDSTEGKGTKVTLHFFKASAKELEENG